MHQLLNDAIPTQHFPQDCIDNADDVRQYRNSLVHDIIDHRDGVVETIDVRDAKKHLCAYLACLDPKWR